MDNATLQRLWQHARSMHNAGHLIEASQAYLSIVQSSPANAAVYYNLGLVYQELGRFDESRRAYEATVKIRPDLAQAHNNLGNVLQKLSLREEALDSYNRAIQLDPTLSPAIYNKAVIELALGHLSRAVGSLQRVVELDSANQTAWAQLFAALIGIKRKQAAIDVFVRWQAVGQITVPLLTAGLVVSRLTGNAGLEEQYLSEVDRWSLGSATAEELMPLLGILSYFDISKESLFACYQRFDKALQPGREERISLLPRRGPGRLRIGYVSADFRRHVMGRILLDVISAHDRNKVEVFLISLCEPRYHDAITQQFRQMAAGFADISALDDRRAAQAIAEADIDVLIDLAAVTEAARPALYARQPARHIVTHLGYHGCIGLRQVEYKLTDRKVEADGSQEFQIEKPYFLDSCFIPLVPVPDTGEVSGNEQAAARRLELRRKWGLDGRFVFATFVGPLKLSPECLDAWREVLQSVPNSVLAFSPLDAEDRALILGIAARAGIAEAQVRFIDAQLSMDEPTLRERYRAVDAVLDTFPYAGGDTTLAALDRNVPVVTLVGDRTPTRTGYSILSHLGLTETIANSRVEYVEIAVKLAGEPEWCSMLRQKIESLRKSPSGIGVSAHVRELERAYADIARIDQSPAGRLAARDFLRQFQHAVRAHQSIAGAENIDEERLKVDELYAGLSAEQPDYVPLLYARGMLAQESGRDQHAMEFFAHAIEVDRDHDSSRLALASLLADANRMREVIDLLAPVAEMSFSSGSADVLLARAYLDEGQYDQAESAARRAVDAAPSDPDAAFIYGLVLCHLGRGAEALAMFNRTLGARGRHVEAAYNAAIIACEGGDPSTAEMLFRRVLEIDSRHEFAHWRLTRMLLRSNRTEEYVAAAKAFAKACPDSLRAKFCQAVSMRYVGQLIEETRQLRLLADALLASQNAVEVEELLRALLELAAQDDFDAELMRLLQQQSMVATGLLHGSQPHSLPSRRQGLIRIGYLVSDVSNRRRENPVWMICGHHNHDRFEVSIYVLDRAAMQASPSPAVQTVDVAGWSVPRIVEHIAGHDLDVIIDTTSLADEKGSAVIAQNVARTSLCIPWCCAHPVKPTSFRLSGVETELPSASTLLPALPITMTRAIWPLNDVVPLRDDRFSRQAMAVPEQRVVLAILAPLEQVSSRCLATWRALVESDASITLLLVVSGRHTAPAWLRVFNGAGIDSNRMMMVDGETSAIRDSDLSTIVDAVLDTFPANDPGSTIDAIRSALPVVTLAGALPAERVGLSLLSTLGVGETVAGSGAEYAEIARKLAANTAWRRDLAQRMKFALADSPLTDIAGYMGEYEDVLQQLVERAVRPAGAD